MQNGVPTVWSIHANGEYFNAEILFLNEKCIALGWPLVGDLRLLPAKRAAFQQRVDEIYKPTHGITAERIRGAGGALHKFLTEIGVGDLMVCRADNDGQILLGEVTGDYEFDTNQPPANADALHRRAVTWHQPKSYFSDIAQKAAAGRQPLRVITDKLTILEFVKALKRAKADVG
jgi:predicted Mrr-cat superfamily restriction endonuclease